MQTHVVQCGETLEFIAQRHRVSVGQIAKANQLHTGRLVTGQALAIPVPRRTHVAQPGETVGAIAQIHGLHPENIMQANHLSHPVPLPGTILHLPKPARRVIDVYAYLSKTDETGQSTVQQLGSYLTHVNVFAYQVQSDGSVTPMDNLNDAPIVKQATAMAASPLVVITNFTSATGFDPDLAHTILATPNIQATLIRTVQSILRKTEYQGVSVDFEYIYPADRDLLTAFLRRLASQLRPRGWSVSLALPPTTSDEQASNPIVGGFDFAAIGQIVDSIFLMTYEYAWAGGPAGAVAPIPGVTEALEYALSKMAAEKIMMGIPLFGHDWTLPFQQGAMAATLSPDDATQLALTNGATIQYDQQAQSPWFRYVDATGQTHEVWFEDVRSMTAKFNLVNQYRIGGIGYWELAFPFAQNWSLLQDNFKIRKL